MKPKKLNLSEITRAYIIVEPFIEKNQTEGELFGEVLSSGKGKDLFRLFYNIPFPDDISQQVVLLKHAVDKNNFVDFIAFMSEISNA